MKNLFRFVLLSVIAAYSHSAELAGTIKGLYVNQSNLVLLTLNVQVPGGHSCQKNNMWQFAFPLDSEAHQAMYSTLLATKMSGQAIRVGYNDTCSSVWNAINPSYVYFYD
ncbi:hypothetical protein [Reinekea sp. G2M2-21]|uniref:hypothetical protein n=1 Tax=Reinekea sp. G2M2-21 TaxID=2788942 RepID=UPI0018A92330|nr:hypothetical protein [Reinekea sp. G2M2-21]